MDQFVSPSENEVRNYAELLVWSSDTAPATGQTSTAVPQEIKNRSAVRCRKATLGMCRDSGRHLRSQVQTSIIDKSHGEESAQRSTTG